MILEEFQVDGETGELHGVIEMVNGRWGASLEVNPPESTPAEHRHLPRLLLYDLWEDPLCLGSVHEQRADLAEKYTRLLERQLSEHRLLGRRFTRAEVSPLTPDQLRTLCALGYVQ